MQNNDMLKRCWPRHGIVFLNFGQQTQAPAQPKAVKIPDAPITPQNIPKAPAPLPPPPPPPSKSGIDAQAAADQARMDQRRRQGYAASLIAGDTGGANKKNGSLLG